MDKLAAENARSIGMSPEKHSDATKAMRGKMFGMSETDTVSLYRSCKSAYAFWEQDMSAPEASPLDIVKVNPARSKQVQVLERCTAVATFVRKYGLLTAPADQKADWDRRVAVVRDQLRQASPGERAHQAELDAEIGSVVDGYLSLDIEDKNKKSPPS